MACCKDKDEGGDVWKKVLGEGERERERERERESANEFMPAPYTLHRFFKASATSQ